MNTYISKITIVQIAPIVGRNKLHSLVSCRAETSDTPELTGRVRTADERSFVQDGEPTAWNSEEVLTWFIESVLQAW